MSDAKIGLPPPPVGALTDGEVAMLRAWAEDYAVAQVAAERERCAKLCEVEAEKWRGEQDITDFRLCAALIRAGA
jgi:hypothetical protein